MDNPLAVNLAIEKCIEDLQERKKFKDNLEKVKEELKRHKPQQSTKSREKKEDDMKEIMKKISELQNSAW